jgi:hypothetical protein
MSGRPSFFARLGATLREKGGVSFTKNPLVFICGSGPQKPKGRAELQKLLAAEPRKICPIIADRIWEEIVETRACDALELERKIGNIVDMILIFPESPGSIAELAGR